MREKKNKWKKKYIGERNSERNCTERPRPKVTTSVDVEIVDPSDSLSSAGSFSGSFSGSRSLGWTCWLLLRNFQIHITMRGEASWQTSITFTLTRTHAENTRARALLPTSVSYAVILRFNRHLSLHDFWLKMKLRSIELLKSGRSNLRLFREDSVARTALKKRQKMEEEEEEEESWKSSRDRWQMNRNTTVMFHMLPSLPLKVGKAT